MDDLESKLGSILENPETMQKIMSLAQSLNTGNNDTQNEPASPAAKMDNPIHAFPDIDFSLIQRLSRFAKDSNIDKNEQSLLRALGPYLSRDRISKLEKAMRATKMAKIATTLLGTTALFSPGR